MLPDPNPSKTHTKLSSTAGAKSMPLSQLQISQRTIRRSNTPTISSSDCLRSICRVYSIQLEKVRGGWLRRAMEAQWFWLRVWVLGYAFRFIYCWSNSLLILTNCAFILPKVYTFLFLTDFSFFTQVKPMGLKRSPSENSFFIFILKFCFLI